MIEDQQWSNFEILQAKLRDELNDTRNYGSDSFYL